jgi:hypothetical protein
MNHSSGSLQHYLIIIAIEVAIVCGLQYGDVSPNYAYCAHALTSFDLAYYGFMCGLTGFSLPALYFPRASSTALYITVILACRLIFHLYHAYHRPMLVAESRMGTNFFSTGLWHISRSEQIDLRPLT